MQDDHDQKAAAGEVATVTTNLGQVRVEITRPYTLAQYQNGKVTVGVTVPFDITEGPGKEAKRAAKFCRASITGVIDAELRDLCGREVP